jgi:hypothetical protein
MTVIKFGVKKPKPKVSVTTSKFEVRHGTAAVCQHMVKDLRGAILFHAFLELWVETKRKVIRKHGGKTLEWLFLPSSDLEILSGLSERQISDKAIPALKKCPFFIIKTGRVTRDQTNRYQIHFDQVAFWEEVRLMLDPTSVVTETEHGHTWAKKAVDRKLLPYLFKRLFDGVKGDT